MLSSPQEVDNAQRTQAREVPAAETSGRWWCFLLFNLFLFVAMVGVWLVCFWWSAPEPSSGANADVGEDDQKIQLFVHAFNQIKEVAGPVCDWHHDVVALSTRGHRRKWPQWDHPEVPDTRWYTKEPHPTHQGPVQLEAEIITRQDLTFVKLDQWPATIDHELYCWAIGWRSTRAVSTIDAGRMAAFLVSCFSEWFPGFLSFPLSFSLGPEGLLCHAEWQDNHALIEKLQEERRRLRAQVEEPDCPWPWYPNKH